MAVFDSGVGVGGRSLCWRGRGAFEWCGRPVITLRTRGLLDASNSGAPRRVCLVAAALVGGGLALGGGTASAINYGSVHYDGPYPDFSSVDNLIWPPFDGEPMNGPLIPNQPGGSYAFDAFDYLADYHGPSDPEPVSVGSLDFYGPPSNLPGTPGGSSVFDMFVGISSGESFDLSATGSATGDPD